MKKLIYPALLVFILTGFSACSSYDYYTAAINKTNMSGYHSFAWMPQATNGSKKMDGDAADAKIKDAATNALQLKGLRLNQRNPDLIVSYTTKIGTGARTNYYTPYYGGGYWGSGFYGGLGLGWGWGWAYRPYYYYGAPFPYAGGLTYAEKEHFKEGTLIIDLIDPHTRKIVWRGFGVGEVHHDMQKTIDELPKVVAGVLDQLQLAPASMRRS